jgi:hypothetical protein
VTSCPVCDHAQEGGAECEVCGRALAPALEAEVAVTAIEGLETTALEPAGADGAVEPMAGLEPTLQAGAGEVGADPVPDLEPTLAAPVEAAGELVPDLEATAAPPSGDPRAELPLFPVCRYCRTPAGPGERICGRCGMGLPVRAATAAAGPGPRLCSCGTPITRAVCPACGARNQAA